MRQQKQFNDLLWVKRAGPVLFLVLMYRKLLLFFSLVNYLQVWWAELAHWRVTRDIGVCSWEKGMERLPPDWHQCLELAVSYLGTLILWELFSPNHTASHLFFFPGGCWMSLPVPAIQKKTSQKTWKRPFCQRTNKTFPTSCSLYHKKLGAWKERVLFSRGRCSLTSVLQKAMINS